MSAASPTGNGHEPCHEIEAHGPPLIVMEDITKIFKTPAGDFMALQDITTCFYQGEFVSVLGRSGSGKSTLVNMLTGIDRPSKGTVCVQGECIQGISESKMSAWRGRNLGIVFQFFQLLPTLTLLENVMLPMDFCNVYAADERPARAMDLLRLVNLENFADKLPAAVSGGQQQTTAIARALANNPPVLIADEPTGNLDTHTADYVFSIFTQLVDQGKTILMVTHDETLAERTDRILRLSDGELVGDHRQVPEWRMKAVELRSATDPVQLPPAPPAGLRN
jgi:putative ABC transport system ATP-binding protein